MTKTFSYILKSKTKVAHITTQKEVRLGDRVTFEADGMIHEFSRIFSRSSYGNVTTLCAGKYKCTHIATNVTISDRLEKEEAHGQGNAM